MSFDTERFIVEIQNRPSLWDSATKDYSDRNLKIKCWGEIVHLFKENAEMTIEEKKQLCKYTFILLGYSFKQTYLAMVIDFQSQNILLICLEY